MTNPAPFRPALLGLAGVLIVFFVGFAVYELRAVRIETAAVAELHRQHAADEQRLQQLRRTEKSVAAETAREEAKLKPAQAPKATTGGKAALSASRKAARAYAQAFFAKYPQARGMLIDYMSKNMANYYAPFFRAAGLSQAQIDQFLAQTAQLHLDTLELNPDGIWRVGKGNLSADDARSILGDAGYQQWQNALLTLPAQGWVAGLALGIKNGAAPLTSEQITQVTQAVAANSPDYADGKAVALPSVDWASAAQQAQTLMSDAQWQEAQNYLTLQAANRRLMALMKGAQ